MKIRPNFSNASGRPLGKDGMRWLKLHCINLTGKLKRASIAEREQEVERLMPLIIDSAEKPLEGKRVGRLGEWMIDGASDLSGGWNRKSPGRHWQFALRFEMHSNTRIPKSFWGKPDWVLCLNPRNSRELWKLSIGVFSFPGEWGSYRNFREFRDHPGTDFLLKI